MPDPDLTAMYQMFLDLNARAFAGRHYEAAYCALDGALHCAEELRDAGRLSEVRRQAETQGGTIDRDAPTHRVSSLSAAARGHRGIFASLAGQSAAFLQGVEAQGRLDEAKREAESISPAEG